MRKGERERVGEGNAWRLNEPQVNDIKSILPSLYSKWHPKKTSIEISYIFFRWGIINETSQTLRPVRKHAHTHT